MSFIGDPEEILNPNEQLAVEETAMARPDILTDSRAISERIFDRLAELMPGWQAADGSLTTWTVEEFSTISAELRLEAATVPEAIFQTYGEEVLGIPAQPPQPAVGYSTWTAVDDRGYLVEAGTQLSLSNPGDTANPVAFEVIGTVRIPFGQTTVEGVEIRSIVETTAGNNLSGEAELIDPLSWVESVYVEEPTRDGLAGQTVEDYLTTLILLFRLQAIRPILPLDFAIIALTRVPGVGRAIAADTYDPSTGAWGVPRMITLILADQYGEPVSEHVKQQTLELLQGLREVNFVVNVLTFGDPPAGYAPIDVTYQVVAFAEQDPEIVRETVNTALRDYLSPMNFRLGVASPSIAGGELVVPPSAGFTPGRQTLRVNDLVAFIDRQRGVDFIPLGGVQINGVAGDYVFDSPFVLPRPGQIDGTVAVPGGV